MKMTWPLAFAVTACMAFVVICPSGAAAGEPSLATPDGKGSPEGEPCGDGVRIDSGVPAGGGSISELATDAIVVTRLTPPRAPYDLELFCACLRTSSSEQTMIYNVIIYDDDGPGGTPGTPVASAGPYNASSLEGEGSFYTANVSGADIVLPSGSFYAGIQWNPSEAPGTGFCTESYNGAPVTYLQHSLNPGFWNTLQSGFGDALLAAFRLAGEVRHSADVDHNGAFNLGELLRMVQLYNAEALHCDNAEEDGFAPGLGATTCDRHGADFQEGESEHWKISLSELLREVQLFNNGVFHYCASGGSEDTFCSGV